MADRDYYDILGVPRDATQDQIKKAYRAHARKYHPDVNPGDKNAEKLFKEGQEAYDVLSDPEKRALYDRYGKAAFEGVGAAGPRSGASAWTAQQAGPEFETIDFSQFFGGGEEGIGGGIFEELLGRMRGGVGRRTRGPRPGRSVEAHLTIPFLTAVRGGETSIEVQRDGGRRETLVVKIPPGTESGARLRLRGRGEPGVQGGPPGDLTITVEVQPHPYFTREGRDLYVDLPVSVSEAILGAKVEVPTLEGLKTVTIPPGTSSGQKLRLRGQGVPASGGQPAGDLFAVVKILVPRTTDEESKELIRRFTERNVMRPREGLWRE
ncbi:MAG: DnaJ domain-containing protein [Isosphaeraceae bacterium]|nr:DnaJ domain-containing protein [Isosphaeraceae bacterium]